MENNINLKDVSRKEDYGVANFNKLSDGILRREFDILRIKHSLSLANIGLNSFMSKNYGLRKKSSTTLESESKYEGE